MMAPTQRTLAGLLVPLLLAAGAAACTSDSSTPGWEYRVFPGDDEDAGDATDPGAADSDAQGDPDAEQGDDTVAGPDAVTGDDSDPGTGGEALPCSGHALCQTLLAGQVSVCQTAACVDGTCLVLPAPNSSPCDDGDACTSDDRCLSGTCGGAQRDCDDGDVCTSDGCNPADGACFTTPLDSAAFPCDDGDACTEGDACAAGVCTGAPVTCDDDNPCTTDACTDPGQGCVNDPGPKEGTGCNDGSVCTTDDTCVAGHCVGTSSDCTDGNPCTADACDPLTGDCSFLPSAALDGLTCEDGDLCTVLDACGGGLCVGGPSPCAGDGCTVSECNADDGGCTLLAALADGEACDDGDPCSVGDACDAGACVGAGGGCDDGNPCTLDTCDPGTGACDSDAGAADGEACEDGDACTAGGVCADGVCAGPPLNCDDGNPCTVDTCGDGGCAHDAVAAAGQPCEADGDPCTVGGTCLESTCTETPKVCDDGNPCTTDSCDSEAGGCVASPTGGAPCSDGDACTSGDTCDETGGCAPGAAVACDDGDSCTVDWCDPAAGCKSTLDSADPACHVLGPCNATDVPGSKDPEATECVCALDPFCCDSAWDSVCVDGAMAACDVVCGCDGTEAAAGCLTDADCSFCDADGDACNGGAACVEGRCAATEGVVCPELDLGPCLANACQSSTGDCVISPVPEACDDGLACTDDVCDVESGQCSSTETPLCSEQSCCVPSGQASCDDADLVDCVCALEPACCFDSWSKDCVALAETQCAATCDCGALGPDDLACDSDADCAFCDDGDLCNGAWSCGDEGVCQPLAPPDCSAVEGCQVGGCVPETGACVVTGDDTLCDDGDLCTNATCDAATGACVDSGTSPCGLQHPCTVDKLPTSNDPAVTECVCALDPFCCDTGWDASCVDKAIDSCGQTCGCNVFEQPCATDEGCLSCDDGDACNGTWACIEGTCVGLAPVECAPVEGPGGCVEAQCIPATGLCEATPVDASCDDGDACTVDTCDDQTGACEHVAAPACSSHSPCTPAETPQSSDPVVDACVCESMPECCTEAWTEGCVVAAQELCGAACFCEPGPGGLTTIPCGDDADCGFCATGDLCAGAWTCAAGVCQQGAALECPGPPPGSCYVASFCDPELGSCDLVGDDSLCDAAPPCTIGRCDGGSDNGCSYIPQLGCTAPFELCVTHEEPASTDGQHPATVALITCLCQVDPFCCESSFDQICVDGVTNTCGFACGCAGAAEPLPCSDDAQCASCDDDGDACNGTWACVDGGCVEVGAPTCEAPPGSTCLDSTCDPQTGGCVAVAQDGLCETGEACAAGVCDLDSGQCTSVPVPGCTGSGGEPCGAWPLPGSIDGSVEDCVCAADPYCCDNQWDLICANAAAASCGARCDCAALPPTARACGSDGDCTRCSAGDLCAGAWTCVEGACEPGAPVTCPALGTECTVSSCNPATGSCETTAVVGGCDDANPCTADTCSAAGQCSHSSIPGCGTGDPCTPHVAPGADDSEVMACVCALEPDCCKAGWSKSCVDLAHSACGLTCDCDTLVEGGVPCQDDDFCRFCDSDTNACNGGWQCIANVCTEVAVPTYCDGSADTGCLSAQCVPETGACEVGPDTSCDDDDPCTVDHCNPVTGGCHHTALDDCFAGPGAVCGAQAVPLPYGGSTACVCVDDPFCCGVVWDAACAAQAATKCGLCEVPN